MNAKKFSINALSDKTGIDRRTLKKWLGDTEGSNGSTFTLDQALDAIRKNRDTKGKNSALDRVRNAQADRAELQVAILKRDYVRRADVEVWVADMILNAKKVLLGLPPALAPQVIGLTAIEAEARLKDSIHSALQYLHEQYSK